MLGRAGGSGLFWKLHEERGVVGPHQRGGGTSNWGWGGTKKKPGFGFGGTTRSQDTVGGATPFVFNSIGIKGGGSGVLSAKTGGQRSALQSGPSLPTKRTTAQNRSAGGRDEQTYSVDDGKKPATQKGKKEKGWGETKQGKKEP